MPVEVILQHGWGFDARIWNGWTDEGQRFSNKPTLFHIGERGYYSEQAKAAAFTQSQSFKVVVAHSLGLHFLERELLAQADAVCIIAGFLAFHPQEELAGKRSKRLTRMMKEKLDCAPYTILGDFLRLCYSNSDDGGLQVPLVTVPHGENIQTERLYEDLDLLDRSDLKEPITAIRSDAVVCVIHGTADRVVAVDKAVEFVLIFPQARVFLVEHGCHALPAFPEICTGYIRDTLLAKLETNIYANLSS